MKSDKNNKRIELTKTDKLKDEIEKEENKSKSEMIDKNNSINDIENIKKEIKSDINEKMELINDKESDKSNELHNKDEIETENILSTETDDDNDNASSETRSNKISDFLKEESTSYAVSITTEYHEIFQQENLRNQDNDNDTSTLLNNQFWISEKSLSELENTIIRSDKNYKDKHSNARIKHHSISEQFKDDETDGLNGAETSKASTQSKATKNNKKSQNLSSEKIKKSVHSKDDKKN